MDWGWNEEAVWNPAKEASKRFRMQIPADVTLCEPSVRVLSNSSTFRGESIVMLVLALGLLQLTVTPKICLFSVSGISLNRIEDFENGVRFVL